MKKKYYIISGIVILMLTLPLLVAELLSWQTPGALPVGKTAIRRIIPNPHLVDVLEQYEREIEFLKLVSRTPGAAIAVVRDSSIVYLKGFGVREAGKKDSVDAYTVFRIASVSKCFASFLTGILVSDSLLSWNDPVIRYLPDFRLKSPEQTQKLQIKHVLSHTTGLPFHAYTTLVEDGMPLQDMLARLSDVQLISEVGEMYSYQNVAYSLIGEVIRSGTGKSYEGWMIEKVFTPLNMENASMDYASMLTNRNHAKPHAMVKAGWKPVKITDTYYNVAPAGGINASINDMANWMIALLGHRPDVITPEMLDQLYAPAVKAPSKNRNYGRMQRLSDTYYGLGWRILYYPDDTLVYHGGYVNGFRSEVAVNRKERLAICILANAAGELADNGIPLFFKLFKARRDSIRSWDEKQRKLLQHSLSLP